MPSAAGSAAAFTASSVDTEAPAPVEAGAGGSVVADAGTATAGAATSPAVRTPASKDFLDCSDM
ncbi:hypothetical protein GCM10010977_14440 [Citricoccus zhacaiensis]|uniref:Uncharacterized protein n=1 Tax=Citricoccus zhacaiensis TaxID=489142 RepID=A0ABQ2LXT0_9MICC|nr:hypothetical protein GCM10010977_14440 [Citricoccus zhacaiensis]